MNTTTNSALHALSTRHQKSSEFATTLFSRCPPLWGAWF